MGRPTRDGYGSGTASSRPTGPASPEDRARAGEPAGGRPPLVGPRLRTGRTRPRPLPSCVPGRTSVPTHRAAGTLARIGARPPPYPLLTSTTCVRSSRSPVACAPRAHSSRPPTASLRTDACPPGAVRRAAYRVCHGAQYNRDAPDVHFKSKSLADVLSTTFGVRPDSSRSARSSSGAPGRSITSDRGTGNTVGPPRRSLSSASRPRSAPRRRAPPARPPARASRHGPRRRSPRRRDRRGHPERVTAQPQPRAGQFLRPLPDRS